MYRTGLPITPELWVSLQNDARRGSGHKAKRSTVKAKINSKGWRRMKIAKQTAAVQSALLAQSDVVLACKELTTILSTLDDPTCSTAPTLAERLEGTRLRLEGGIKGVNKYFSISIATELFNERHAVGAPTDNSHRIWAVTEVVESIFANLSVHKLFKLRQVCRLFRDTIQISPSLQSQMYLRPNPRNLFSVPFSTGPFPNAFPMSFTNDDEDNSQGEEDTGPDLSSTQVRLRVNVDYRRQYTGHIHPSMLICQPPVFELDAVPSCCEIAVLSERLPANFIDMPSPPHTKISSTTGLTIGDIFAAAKGIFEEHALCPFGPAFMHDIKGFVRPEIAFSGHVNLREGDPALESLKGGQFFDVYCAVENGRQMVADPRNVDPYIALKQVYFAENRPIPTYPEFLAIVREVAESFENEEADADPSSWAEDDE